MIDTTKPRYIRKGHCNRCGQCCLTEDCEHLLIEDGLATCLIHEEDRPLKCTSYPCNPPIMYKGCGYYFIDTWDNNREIRGRYL